MVDDGDSVPELEPQPERLPETVGDNVALWLGETEAHALSDGSGEPLPTAEGVDEAVALPESVGVAVAQVLGAAEAEPLEEPHCVPLPLCVTDALAQAEYAAEPVVLAHCDGPGVPLTSLEGVALGQLAAVGESVPVVLAHCDGDADAQLLGEGVRETLAEPHALPLLLCDAVALVHTVAETLPHTLAETHALCVALGQSDGLRLALSDCEALPVVERDV